MADTVFITYQGKTLAATLVAGSIALNGSGAQPSASSTSVVPASDATFNTSPVSSSAAANSLTPVTVTSDTKLLVKASAGNFYGGSMVAGATGGFLIAYNANAVPAAGALTAANILAVVPVAANGFGAIGDFQIPDRFSSGVALLFSTAANAYTVPANAAAFMRGRAA